MIFTIDSETSYDINSMGKKSYSLCILDRNGFNVPEGVIITKEVFESFLKNNKKNAEIKKLLSSINSNNIETISKRISKIILDGKLPLNIINDIMKKIKHINTNIFALRSSGLFEDTDNHSSAGLYDSYICVPRDISLICHYIKSSWASLYSIRALYYRRYFNLNMFEVSSIIIQKTINANISGVTFTIHPLQKNMLILNCCLGLGNQLAQGKGFPDEYIIDRETQEVVKIVIGKNKEMDIINNNIIERRFIDKSLINKQVLNLDQVEQIVDQSLKIEKLFKAAQDIEWCIKDSDIFILQARNISRYLNDE